MKRFASRFFWMLSLPAFAAGCAADRESSGKIGEARKSAAKPFVETSQTTIGLFEAGWKPVGEYEIIDKPLCEVHPRAPAGGYVVSYMENPDTGERAVCCTRGGDFRTWEQSRCIPDAVKASNS